MIAAITTYGGEIRDGYPVVKHWQLAVDGYHISDTSDEAKAALLIRIANLINDYDQNV